MDEPHNQEIDLRLTKDLSSGVTRPIVCFQWTSHTFGLTAHPI